jgi:hypothetical protein
MRIVETIVAWGHPHITGKNSKTLEVTKNSALTKRGDCIIAVKASKGASDIGQSFKELVKQKDAIITLIVKVNNLTEVFVGRGSPQLSFTHREDLVVRKSNYTCSRTLMIQADKAAIDVSRRMIELLQNPQQKVEINLLVEG